MWPPLTETCVLFLKTRTLLKITSASVSKPHSRSRVLRLAKGLFDILILIRVVDFVPSEYSKNFAINEGVSKNFT